MKQNFKMILVLSVIASIAGAGSVFAAGPPGGKPKPAKEEGKPAGGGKVNPAELRARNGKHPVKGLDGKTMDQVVKELRDKPEMTPVADALETLLKNEEIDLSLEAIHFPKDGAGRAKDTNENALEKLITTAKEGSIDALGAQKIAEIITEAQALIGGRGSEKSLEKALEIVMKSEKYRDKDGKTLWDLFMKLCMGAK